MFLCRTFNIYIMKSIRILLSRTVVLLVVVLCLSVTASAQVTEDSVTIRGLVSDYEGNAIGNCLVMLQNSNFDVLFETRTDKNGMYQLRIPEGRYNSMAAIDMDTYPHTMKPGTGDEDLRLEFWAWNFIADRDTTLDIRYHRMEAYGVHVFHIPGGMPTYQIYVRPMSLTRFLASKGIDNARHKEDLSGLVQESSADSARCDNIAPVIDKAGIRVWIDGDEADILMKQQVREYYEADEYGIAYYITVGMPERTSSLPYRIFKVELTDLENGDRGEALYYLEDTDYIESR